MSMFGVQLIIWVFGLLGLFYSAKYFPIIHKIFLFMLFYFALIAFSISDKQAYFYLFGLMFGMLIERYLGWKYKQQADSADLNGPEPGGEVSGRSFEILSVGLAGGMFLVAIIVSAAKGQIMGVAPLAVESATSFQSRLTLAFAPLLSGSLGIIENYVWFGLLIAFVTYKDFFGFIFAMLASIPIPALSPLFAGIAKFLSMVLPYVAVPLSFGVFHVTAYLFDWDKMIWASLMMAQMIASYYITNKDVTAANLFHFSWNSNITAKQTLSIIG